MNVLNNLRPILLGIGVVGLFGCDPEALDTTYNCTNGTCEESPDGIFASLQDCQLICQNSAPAYDCVDGTCEEAQGGTYSSLEACQQACTEEEIELTNITLSIPTNSMITDVGTSTNRLYFTDDNADALYFVVKNGDLVLKDTFYASNLSVNSRSLTFGEIFDLSNEEVESHLAQQVALSIEGFTSSGTMVSKTSHQYLYTAVPTRIQVTIDGVDYAWENFFNETNHRPDFHSVSVYLPEFTILTTWPTECGNNDPNGNLKANIHVREWGGSPSSGTRFWSSGVAEADCGGSVVSGGPIADFVNGSYYSIEFTGIVGEDNSPNTKTISGTITQAFPEDGQGVESHLILK